MRYRFSFAQTPFMAQRNLAIQSYYHGNGYSKTRIARIYGLSPARVGKIIHDGGFATEVLT